MIEALTDEALLESIHLLVRRSGAIEADVLVHLGEIDERKLYLSRAFPSLFSFCVEELGFSEDAAYNRIVVARAGRRFPALVEAVRSGSLHLAGARLLAPHLDGQNLAALLAEAGGKSKRQVEELIAARFPRPAVPAGIRKLQQRAPPACAGPAGQASLVAASRLPTARLPAPPLRAVQPLAGDAFKVQFTASRALRDKLQQAQDLLRHRVPNGDLAMVLEAALDSLIAATLKERFDLDRKARTTMQKTSGPATRHVPAAIKRAVYARDGGRCAFIDDRGRRCDATSPLEFDHVDGFARTRAHSLQGLRLLCRPHNQHAAEQLYGRAFMERARCTKTHGTVANAPATCPGTSSQGRLL